IIRGEIPSYKLIESEFTFSFLDIGPIAKGHALVIPKYHGEKLHDVPDTHLADSMSIAKKIAIASGFENYNILQNNGKIAHQIVPHVHFHVIPKPEESDKSGLVIGWPTQKIEKEDLQAYYESLKGKL
ncbi:HIT-domain-containing protein, partial [Exidia glandulosa HHB12029]